MGVANYEPDILKSNIEQGTGVTSSHTNNTAKNLDPFLQIVFVLVPPPPSNVPAPPPPPGAVPPPPALPGAAGAFASKKNIPKPAQALKSFNWTKLSEVRQLPPITCIMTSPFQPNDVMHVFKAPNQGDSVEGVR